MAQAASEPAAIGGSDVEEMDGNANRSGSPSSSSHPTSPLKAVALKSSSQGYSLSIPCEGYTVVYGYYGFFLVYKLLAFVIIIATN